MRQWRLLQDLHQQVVQQLRWRTWRRQKPPPLHLFVLAVGHCKVSFRRISSLLCRKSVIPTAASTVEYSSCKDLGVHIIELLQLTDCDPPCFCVSNVILNLL
jgi:hypothetical protein